MFIFYGGVALQMENITKWESRALPSDDDADHFVNHFVIGASCVFNPGSADGTGAPGYVPTGAGAPGPTSWQQLKELLLQPRQPLTVVFNGVVVLQSPLPRRGQVLAGGGLVPPPPLPVPGPPPVPPLGAQQFGSVSLPFPPAPAPPLNLVQVPAQPPPLGPLATLYRCDAKNGPHPITVDVREVHGTKTLLVYIEIETWLSYQSPDASTPSVLWHRWEMSHDIDGQHLTRRSVVGKAVFRPDLLLDQPGQAQRVPDDFRFRLLHPVPDNFKRENIHVTASEDGTSVLYSFDDQEQMVNLGLNSPVVKFEGYWRAGYDGATPLPWEVTKRYVSVLIRCWGRRTTLRQQLINACVAAAARFGFLSNLLQADPLPRTLTPPLYYRCDLTVDLADKFVELNLGAYIDGKLSFGALIGSDLFRIRSKVQYDFPDDTAPRILPDGSDPTNPTTPPPTDNPRPPKKGVRGTYLGRLVAQQLTPEWATPAPPPNPDPPAADFSF